MIQQIVRKRLRNPRTHSKAGADQKEWRFQQRTSRRLGRVSTARTNRWRWARDFWSIQGSFICRHHNESRVQLYVSKEETFPIPLKYIDVTRSTHTDLDVLQEKRIDDYWHVDENRNLSNSWRGFTKFTLLKKNLQKDILGLVGDWRKFNRPPVQIMYDQKFGRELVKPLRIENIRNGPKRHQSSTMFGDR